jgi:hypothetical protein
MPYNAIAFYLSLRKYLDIVQKHVELTRQKLSQFPHARLLVIVDDDVAETSPDLLRVVAGLCRGIKLKLFEMKEELVRDLRCEITYNENNPSPSISPRAIRIWCQANTSEIHRALRSAADRKALETLMREFPHLYVHFDTSFA